MFDQVRFDGSIFYGNEGSSCLLFVARLHQFNFIVNEHFTVHRTNLSVSIKNPTMEQQQPSVDLLDAALQQKLYKKNDLEYRIQKVRSQRKLVRKQTESLSDLQVLWGHRYNQAIQKRTNALSSYSQHHRKLDEIQAAHEKLIQCYVLQDVFHIWYRGAYATINGLRLGMCTSPSVEASSPAVQEQTNSFWNNNNVNGSAALDNNVPWHEINAALGMIALLMKTLQNKLHIYQSRYMIQPRGSTTKVLSRKTKQEWELYHQPTAFQFFARRNWNAALNILGYTLYEIVREVNILKKSNGIDRIDWVIPFDLSLEGDWGNERIANVKIGGLEVGFNGDGVEWTKAMRYIAIDLKLIVAFVATFVDRRS